MLFVFAPVVPLTVVPLTVLPLTVLPLTVLPLTVLPLTVVPLTVLPLTAGVTVTVTVGFLTVFFLVAASVFDGAITPILTIRSIATASIIPILLMKPFFIHYHLLLLVTFPLRCEQIVTYL